MSTVIPGALAKKNAQNQKPATPRAVPGTLVLRDSTARITAHSVALTGVDPGSPALPGTITFENTAVIRAKNSSGTIENSFSPRWSDNVSYLDLGTGGLSVRSVNDTFATRVRVKTTGQVRFVPLAADPSGAEAGDVYYNSGSNKLKVYNGTSWVDLH